jgi:hypothetical protein
VHFNACLIADGSYQNSDSFVFRQFSLKDTCESLQRSGCHDNPVSGINVAVKGYISLLVGSILAQCNDVVIHDSGTGSDADHRMDASRVSDLG